MNCGYFGKNKACRPTCANIICLDGMMFAQVQNLKVWNFGFIEPQLNISLFKSNIEISNIPLNSTKFACNKYFWYIEDFQVALINSGT